MMNFLNRLLGDEQIVTLLSSEKDIEAMIRFELALVKSQAACDLVPVYASEKIYAHLQSFRPDENALAEATLRDGVVVPELVRQMRDQLPGNVRDYLHFGATSQDVIDTAFAVKMAPVFYMLEDRIAKVLNQIDVLTGRFGCNPLMGRTRMQQAIPIHVLDRLNNWRGPLSRAFESLGNLEQSVRILSLAGAAGTSDKFGSQASPLRSLMAEELDLSVPDYVPHAQRDRLANLANWLSLVTGALGKIGQDIALMAQNEIAEVTLSGAGGSSAMPHKQNPVRAETLVTLAQFNATQLSGLHLALVHEQERSGTAWALEWMILPRMIEVAATSLTHALNLLESIERMGSVVPKTAETRRRKPVLVRV